MTQHTTLFQHSDFMISRTYSIVLLTHLLERAYDLSSARRIYDQYILQFWNAVAQLVEALRYKPEGRGFDSRWCHWNFSLT